MITLKYSFLQKNYNSFTMVLHFFTSVFYFVVLGAAKNLYNFYSNFSPPRVRVFFLLHSFFLKPTYYKKSVFSVIKFKESVKQGFIRFFKKCKESEKLCKEVKIKL